MPYVKHPAFPADVREVTDAQLKEFTEAGWLKVNKNDEAKAEAQLAQPANQ